MQRHRNPEQVPVGNLMPARRGAVQRGAAPGGEGEGGREGGRAERQLLQRQRDRRPPRQTHKPAATPAQRRPPPGLTEAPPSQLWGTTKVRLRDCGTDEPRRAAPARSSSDQVSHLPPPRAAGARRGCKTASAVKAHMTGQPAVRQ